MEQSTRSGGIGMVVPRPSAPAIALYSIATGWPAAAYGALVIWAAGDFASTGTLWIFGWPFLIELLAATVLHLCAVGAGMRLGIPAAVPGIAVFDDALARVESGTCDTDRLRDALAAVVRFPRRNLVIGLALSAMVAAGMALLERLAAGPGSPNVAVILRGGVYATLLYGAACLTVSELFTRPACHAVRRAAAAADVEPYQGYALSRGWRMAAAVIPTIVTLLVAVEISHSSGGGRAAYTALVALSAVVATALYWLQDQNSRSAVRELGDACRDLAAGHEWGLITGSIEPVFLEMARDFRTAARHVGADRRASGERYRAVFEAALDCIITMDHEGRILEFNPAAEQTFGYTRAEVLGKSLADTIIPPALRDQHDAGLARYLATGQQRVLGKRLELPALRADGTEFPAEIAITRLRPDGAPVFTAHLRDITARKRAEAALNASTLEAEEQAEVAAALLRVGDTMNAHLNQQDLLARLSQVTVETLGCDSTTILVWDRARKAFVFGANAGSLPAIATEMEHVEFTAERFAILRTLRPGSLVELSEVAHSAFPPALAERWRIAALLAAPISRGDDMLGVILATYEDGRAQFSAKQRRLALGAASAAAIGLENARLIADLRTASQLKTEFVSTMSHELRTPLNVILGFCEMIRDPATSEREENVCLERIEMAARLLLELVESTLEVGRLEAGREEPQLESVPLGPMWEKLGREYAVLPRRGSVVLEWGPCPPDVVLLADPRRLAMIVRNLVSNALKFTDDGFVRAEALLDGNQVLIRVSDSGIGIEPADQEKVFEMFCQGDGSDSRRHGGTGLGLYIVRGFAEQLGGTVELASTPGQGSAFTVRLPLPGVAEEIATARARRAARRRRDRTADYDDQP